MRNGQLHILLLFTVLLGACVKRKYPDNAVENSAVYTFAGTVNNEPISLAAGINSYYMYASYGQDVNGVYNFIGELKQLDCSNCTSSLKIQINDFRVSAQNAPMQPDSSLFPHAAAFLGNTHSYEAQFQSQFNKPAAAYDWNFGDGTHSSLQHPSHAYAATGTYPVTLKITSAGGCQSTIRQNERISVQPDYFSSSISAADSAGVYIRFTHSTQGGQQPYSYSWSFGDGTTSTAASPLHRYGITGSYPVTLRVADAANQVVTAEYNAVTQNDQSSCAANYSVAAVSRIIDPFLALALSKIIVTWTDANGVVYTSNSDLQPAGSHFEITSAEDAGTNEKNMPIKKLHIKFNCMVYNGATALAINNAEATIGVAYK